MINKIIGCILLILLSPLFLIVCILIFLDDGLPVLYTQKRIGINNSIFVLYKFRTMKRDVPDLASHLLKDSKSLFTLIGPTLRKLSLDELPQILNIMKGDLHFIGPRPALHNQVDLKELRTKAGIHKLIPGITGWAQINGRDELSIPDKVKLDEYYLNNKSCWLNTKIVLLTIYKVVRMRGISH